MSGETIPDNENSRSQLKLRKSMGWVLGLFGLGWVVLTVLPRFWTPMFVAGPLFILFVIIRERVACPPVLRFWEDGSDYALRVRRPATGAVQYQAKQNTLNQVDLREVDFSGCHLQDISAVGADFRGANLSGANLSGADLATADLRGATLQGTRLHSTRLVEADLRGADLCGADFRRRDFLKGHTQDYLCGADFRGATYSAATHWPRDFDPIARGCIFVDTEPADLPIPSTVAASDARQLPVASDGSARRSGHLYAEVQASELSSDAMVIVRTSLQEEAQ